MHSRNLKMCVCVFVFLCSKREPRLKNRDGALGRVIKSTPIPQDILERVVLTAEPVEKHPFTYDVDFVLGGRITNCHRREFVYSSAEAEGMLADGGTARAKRKRKPSSVVLQNQEPAAPPEPKKKRANNNKGGAKKGGKGKGVKTATKANAKSNPSKANAKGASKNNNNNAKQQAQAEAKKKEEPLQQLFKDEIVVKDLYERHKRDFDRALARLEKVDQFGFFFDKPKETAAQQQQQQEVKKPAAQPAVAAAKSVEEKPPPYDETSAAATALTALANLAVLTSEPEKSHSITDAPPPPPPQGDIKAGGAQQQQPLESISSSSDVKKTNSSDEANNHDDDSTPADQCMSPPLSWYDIRERIQADRYVFDRLQHYEKERTKRLGPYKWYRRKKQLNKATENKMEKWDVLEKGGKGGTTEKVKVSLKDVNGQRVHPRVLHQKGVHWDLFRKDVLAMCEAAMKRDPLGTTGGSGTLGHAANKVKNVSFCSPLFAPMCNHFFGGITHPFAFFAPDTRGYLSEDRETAQKRNENSRRSSRIHYLTSGEQEPRSSDAR